MRARDYFNVFNKALRANPKPKNLPIAEISRKIAMGESFADVARKFGVTPQTIRNLVRAYRSENATSFRVLVDISAERARDLHWLDIASRSGWFVNDGRDERDIIAENVAQYLQLMSEYAAKEDAPTIRRKPTGRPRKDLPRSAYDAYVKGTKTLKDLAAEYSMSVATVGKRLLEHAGPGVRDLKSIVTPDISPQKVEEIVEDVIETAHVGEPTIVAPHELPRGFEVRDEIIAFAEDGDIPNREIAEVYGLTEADVEVLLALNASPAVESAVVEKAIEASEAIEDAAIEALPDSVDTPAVPVSVKKKRGRAKKTFDFTDEQREEIRVAYYDERLSAKEIAKFIGEQRGESVTQTAIKEVIAEYSTGRGPQKKEIDLAELKRRSSLPVSILAERFEVSIPTIAKRLKEMKIQPNYSRTETTWLDINRREQEAAKTKAKVDKILNDPAERESVRQAYLNTNLVEGNNIESVAFRFNMRPTSMKHILRQVFAEELAILKAARSPLDAQASAQELKELNMRIGADQANKLRRDFEQDLRGNPAQSRLMSNTIGASVGIVSSAVLDQGILQFYPFMSTNKRNLISGGTVVGVSLGVYAYSKNESALYSAAGGVVGTLISRMIEKKLGK